MQQQDNITMLRKLRLLLALKFTVKALSTKVLFSCRPQFQKISPSILTYVASVWNSTNQQILSFLKASEASPTHMLPNELGPMMEACKLSLQTSKCLLRHGISKINEDQTAIHLLVAILPSLKTHIQYGIYFYFFFKAFSFI